MPRQEVGHSGQGPHYTGIASVEEDGGGIQIRNIQLGIQQDAPINISS
jgi:hypothetical protein